MKAIFKISLRRQRRKARSRRNITGTAERPRLTVFRSNENIYAQIINDVEGRTLVAASTMQKDLRGQMAVRGNKAAAQSVGEALAAKAIAAGIKQVVFDRSGYPYHGRVKELADAARKGGLQF